MTETRSRSARNATQSFPSNMFSFRKKDGEELRMHFAAPSFFSPIGECIEVRSPREARKSAEEHAPCIVVFQPSLAVFSSPRSWANALSSASALIVEGDGGIKEFKAFMTLIDGIVFSPVPRKLASAFLAGSDEEAASYVSAMQKTFPSVITIKVLDNTEDEE